jgi:hypothetical protein
MPVQCNLWLAFWCDLFGALMVVATALLSVALTDQLGAAAVGIAISNTIQVRVNDYFRDTQLYLLWFKHARCCCCAL